MRSIQRLTMTKVMKKSCGMIEMPKSRIVSERACQIREVGVEMGEGAWEKVETTEVERQSIRKQEKEDAFKILKEFDLMEYVVCVCVFCVGRGWWGL